MAKINLPPTAIAMCVYHEPTGKNKQNKKDIWMLMWNWNHASPGPEPIPYLSIHWLGQAIVLNHTLIQEKFKERLGDLSSNFSCLS